MSTGSKHQCEEKRVMIGAEYRAPPVARVLSQSAHVYFSNATRERAHEDVVEKHAQWRCVKRMAAQGMVRHTDEAGCHQFAQQRLPRREIRVEIGANDD